MRWYCGAILAVFLAASVSPAEEPVVVPAGGFADHRIEVPKGASVIWRYSPQPVQKATDLPPGRIIFGGEAGKTYTVTAIVIDFEKKTVTDADYVFKFSGGVAQPPPKKDPPVDPIGEPAVYYFLVVRPDGPAHPNFTQAMLMPGWTKLRGLGHSVKDKTASQARDLGVVLPPGTVLPTVVTLKTSATESVVVRGPVPLPNTDQEILRLTEGLKP